MPDGGPLSPWQALGAWRITELAGFGGRSHLTMQRHDGKTAEFCILGSNGKYFIEENAVGISFLASYVLDDKVGWQTSETLLIEVSGAAKCWQAIPDGNPDITPTPTKNNRYQSNNWIICTDSGSPSHITINNELVNEVNTDQANDCDIRSPLPGLVNEILFAVGDKVSSGEPVIVIEAMKMIHKLTANVAGTVTEIRCTTGENIPGNVVLMTIEPSSPLPSSKDP